MRRSVKKQFATSHRTLYCPDQVQLTPSDISLKEISIDELDQFVQQAQHLGEIENIYPLTPMQKGMLFHSLIDSASGAYFEQAAFDLKGLLDIEAFMMSLSQLAKRYDILRTQFYTEWKEQPLQLCSGISRLKLSLKIFAI